MARECGYIQPDMTLSRAEIAAERKAWDDAIKEAVAAEREACAQIADDYWSGVRETDTATCDTVVAAEIRDAIRKRSNPVSPTSPTQAG